MVRQRGDMKCFHEPFGEWWYKGDGALWPRLQPDSPRIKGLTFASVWQKTLDCAKDQQVFCKDFPHYVEHSWTDSFLEHFRHSFLIRDPAKIATSMYKHWPEFFLKETGIIEQRKLFDLIADKHGSAPPLIDSDDLLENPYGIVKAWCNALDIPFMPKALSWQPGDRAEASWYDGGSWHSNLRDSDGLKPQPRKYIDISDAPHRIIEIYETVLPHYEHMHQHRLLAV